MLLCNMAKELCHIFIARDVLKGLRATEYGLLALGTNKSLSAFYLGAIIPDALFYDITPFARILQGYVQLRDALHLTQRVRNDETAMRLFDAIATNPSGWRIKAPFAAGIMTHTVTDRIIHGLIDHYTTSWDQEGSAAMASHRQIETLIDMLFLRQSASNPRSFRLQACVSLDKATENYLFCFYLAHLMASHSTPPPSLLKALKRGYASQRVLLKLFALKPLYHIMNLSNKLLADRLLAQSSLFYPDTVGTRSFRVLKELDLNILTNGVSFKGTLASLLDAVTEEAICHIRFGLRRMAP
jgi:hypothetical protein